MKRYLEVAVSVIILGVIAYICYEIFFGASVNNAQSKDALRRIHQEISIGASPTDVALIYERNKTERTQLRTDIFERTWEIRMPFEFGATDPILYIQFNSDGGVSAVAMRTSDGIHHEPPSNYPDKGTFEAPAVKKNQNG